MNRRKPSFFPGLAPGHGTDCPDPIGGTDGKTRFLCFALLRFTFYVLRFVCFALFFNMSLRNIS